MLERMLGLDLRFRVLSGFFGVLRCCTACLELFRADSVFSIEGFQKGFYDEVGKRFHLDSIQCSRGSRGRVGPHLSTPALFESKPREPRRVQNFQNPTFVWQFGGLLMMIMSRFYIAGTKPPVLLVVVSL